MRMKKGSHVINEKMAFLIAIIIIILFLLIWFGVAQQIVNIVGEKFGYSVQTCQQLGATTGDPEDPKTRCS